MMCVLKDSPKIPQSGLKESASYSMVDEVRGHEALQLAMNLA